MGAEAALNRSRCRRSVALVLKDFEKGPSMSKVSQATYYDLVIVAESPDTEIWLGDNEGTSFRGKQEPLQAVSFRVCTSLNSV